MQREREREREYYSLTLVVVEEEEGCRCCPSLHAAQQACLNVGQISALQACLPYKALIKAAIGNNCCQHVLGSSS